MSNPGSTAEKEKTQTTCVNHPDRPARWHCMKFSMNFCDECAKCPHPEGYCRFRPQCLIFQMSGEED